LREHRQPNLTKFTRNVPFHCASSDSDYEGGRFS
jgi:hypothetical protein